MNTTTKYAARLFAALLLTSASQTTLTACSDDEDTTPSLADANSNGFEPLDSDHSETAEIRRDFFSKTGTYLLFNDTLTTTDTQGNPELLQVEWSLMGSLPYPYSYEWRYDYLTSTDQQRQAADALATYVVPKLGKNLPFAFMLADGLWYESYGRKRYTDYILGLRTYCISLNGGEAFDDPEAYFKDLVVAIAIDALSRVDESEMAEFLSYSSQYYNKDLEDFGFDSLSDEEVWKLGMFYYNDGWWVYFYNKNTDIKEWVSAVFANTREEFAQTYGDYSVMMEKYDLMRELLQNRGFQID